MKRLLIPILLFSTSSFAASIQKWVDENGQIHYGDSPPAKAQTESVRVSRPPSNPGKPLPKFNPDEGKETKSSRPELPEEEAKAICDRAHQDLVIIENTEIVRVRTEDDGERVLSKEEIEQRREQAQNDIDTYCR